MSLSTDPFGFMLGLEAKPIFNEMLIILQNYYFLKATYRQYFLFSDAIIMHAIYIIFVW